MKLWLITAVALIALPATATLAGDDCHSGGVWQPREAAVAAAAGLGWRVEKIEADDGCWEIKGLDARGRRIKAKLNPATLKVVKLRHKDGSHEDREHKDGRHGGDGARQGTAPASAPSANPLFQSGAAPVVSVR